MNAADMVELLLSQILPAKNVARMACLLPRIYYLSENAVIVGIRMSIVYANSAGCI